MSNNRKKCGCSRNLIDPDAIDCSHINDSCNKCENECNFPDSVIIQTVPFSNRFSDNDSRIRTASGRGTVKSGDTNLEFAFIIYKENDDYRGQLSVANFDSQRLIFSNDLESYTQNMPFSFIAVFSLPDRNANNTNFRRNVSLYCLEEICGNPAKLFIYSPPFCTNTEIRAGGPVTDGYIKIHHNNHHPQLT